MLDLVAKPDGFEATQTQEIARGNHTADATVRVRHSQMPQVQAAHMTDRAIRQRVAWNGLQRARRELADRQRKRGATLLSKHAHDVVFGDDADLARR